MSKRDEILQAKDDAEELEKQIAELKAEIEQLNNRIADEVGMNKTIIRENMKLETDNEELKEDLKRSVGLRKLVVDGCEISKDEEWRSKIEKAINRRIAIAQEDWDSDDYMEEYNGGLIIGELVELKKELLSTEIENEGDD